MSAPDSTPDERLADWVDGRMSDREQQRFRAELRVNAQLRADLVAYEATIAAVRAALQAPTRPSAMADRVLTAIAAAPAAPAAASPPRRLYLSLLSAAALLALAFLLNAWPASTTAERAADVAAAAPAADARADEAPRLGADAAGRYGGRGALPPSDLAAAAPGAPPPSAVAAQRDQPTVGAAVPAPRADADAAKARREPPTDTAGASATAPTPFLALALSLDPDEPARPAGGGPGRDDAKPGAAPLAGEALRTALAAFLAQAADPAAEPAAAAWTTANGELTASPWLDASVQTAAETARAWIVEGPKDDVAALLAAAAAFARQRGGEARNGEMPAPTAGAAPADAAGRPSARLVLRLQLRRR